MLLNFLLNISMILITILGMFITAKVFKLKSQALLIFILFGVCWTAPLLCRDYCGLIHVHMELNLSKYLMYLPIMINGIAGIFWKPLNDFLSYKLRSRKTMLFVGLGIEAICIIPFVIYPTFTTNIIQSIGAGIGVSILGLFVLLFHQTKPHRRVFSAINALVLPPIFAQMMASSLESLVTCALQQTTAGTDYINIMWFLWIDAIFFVVLGFVLTLFVKEDRRFAIEIIREKKTPIKQESQRWVWILLCFAAASILFVKWATAGPIASVQTAYISKYTGQDTRGYEGYCGLLYAMGQLIGACCTMVAIKKLRKKNVVKICVGVIALLSSTTYLVLSQEKLNIATYFSSGALNGLSYGLLYPILVATVSNYCFAKKRPLTPLGAYNTCMSIGLTFGAFASAYVKGDYFASLHDIGAVIPTEVWNDFQNTCRGLNILCFIFICAAIASFFVSIGLQRHSQCQLARR